MVGLPVGDKGLDCTGLGLCVPKRLGPKRRQEVAMKSSSTTTWGKPRCVAMLFTCCAKPSTIDSNSSQSNRFVQQRE